MSACQHGESADCLECEINYRHEYLAELENLVHSVKQQISQLVQLQVKQVPVIGKVEPAETGNVISWRRGK